MHTSGGRHSLRPLHSLVHSPARALLENRPARLLMFFACALVLPAAFGQEGASPGVQTQAAATATQGSAAPTKPVPPRVLYRLFFRHVIFVERQADRAEKRGENADKLRRYFEISAGLTPEEAAALKEIARDCDTAVRETDEKARLIIAQFHAQYPPGKVSSNDVPPPPPELEALQEEKDSLVLKHRDTLKTSLGEERFRLLDGYVQHLFAGKVTMKMVNPPQSTLPAWVPRAPRLPQNP